MLKNIKSSYIIKLIIAYVDESQKLKLVRYNKNLQKKTNISIINYKHFSGKYIIYESENVGKEYNGYNDELIFEGEYLNGERHGKGKEYNWDGKLLFEGEYIKGKRNGKGKQYFHNFYNSKFYFEGEYLNDKELIGTRYNKNGEIIYKLNNNINRRQIEYYENGQLEFEGEYLNGKRNGKGKEYSYDGNLIFEG